MQNAALIQSTENQQKLSYFPPLNIFLLVSTFLQGKILPAARRKPPPTSTAPEDLVRTTAAWITADFQAASFLKLYSLTVFRTSTKNKDLNAADLWQRSQPAQRWQQCHCFGAAFAHDHTQPAHRQQECSTCKTSSLLWKWFLLANPNENKSTSSFPMLPWSLDIENKLCIQIQSLWEAY